MKPKVIFYCLEWHLNKSGAFKQILIDPVTDFITPELVGWDGIHLPDVPYSKTEISVFCQFPPPIKNVDERFKRLIWVPMWDQSWDKSQSWWVRLPPKINIIAYSKVISQRAHQARINTFDVTYFPNPENFPLVKWEGERVLCYWNRRGLVGPDFLERLVKEINIQRLLFKEETDPLLPYPVNYHLPGKIGRTIVESTENFSSQADYLNWINRSNIFLAPRMMEGVGLTFLEAMAQGSAVISLNAPTMNEYITNNVNGILIPQTIVQTYPWEIQKYHELRRRMLKWFKIPAGNSRYFLSNHQDWSGLRDTKFEIIGNNARKKIIPGNQSWKKCIPKLARFILGD